MHEMLNAINSQPKAVGSKGMQIVKNPGWVKKVSVPALQDMEVQSDVI